MFENNKRRSLEISIGNEKWIDLSIESGAIYGQIEI